MAAGSSGGGAKSKASGGAKTGPKRKASPQKKKKKSPAGKKGSFWSRHRNYILGLSLGLLLGAIGTLGALYLAGPLKPLPQALVERPSAAKTRSPVKSGRVLYEENRRLERRIKKLEQTLYRAFRDLRIPDKDIRFVQVAARSSGGREWDNTRIELHLPPGLTVKKAAAALKRTMNRAALRPRRDASGGAAVDVLFEGLNTHTLLLIPAPARPVRPRVRIPGPRPQVAIVIDDLGRSLAQARCFLDIKAPVAISILPFLPHSAEIAGKAHERRRVVMLHLPMQPVGWPEIDAGEGALFVWMDRPTIRANVRAALDAVPYINGVNTHMGSRFTEDQTLMQWALEPIKKRRLFFMDSFTTTRSTGLAEARRLGIPATRRTTFLDNVQEPEAIRIQLRKLVAQARRQGWAVGIGHPHRVTCQVLKREYNYLASRVDLVPITTVLR